MLAIIGAGIWSTTLSPYFLKRGNLLDLVTPYVFIGLMAFGLTFVVIAGEIDISVVSMLAVSVVCFAQIFDAGVNVWLAGLAALAVATALGLGNGAPRRAPEPAVARDHARARSPRTEASRSSCSAARASPRSRTSYTQIGGGYLWRNQLPVALLVLLGAALVLGLLLHATRFGRYVFTIGSNREAARFSGVPVARVRVSVFALSGLMAGIGGVVYVGYFGSARADAGTGLAPRRRDRGRPRRRRHLRRRRLDARRAARADPRRRAPERDAAREHRRRDPGHRDRRAPPRGDRRRQPPPRRPGERSPLRSARGRAEGRWSITRQRTPPCPPAWKPRIERKVGQMRRKKLGLVGIVAGLAVIATLTVALSAGAGTQAGYKIYFLPKTTTIPVFTQNGIGAKQAGEGARRHGHLQRADDGRPARRRCRSSTPRSSRASTRS